jgi:multiple sugar transport system permease protein
MTRGRRRLGRSGLGALVVAGALFPIYFMLVQSVKTPQEDVAGNPLIVRAPTLDNFRDLLGEPRLEPGIIGGGLLRRYPFVGWLENTLLVFGGSVALTLGLGVAAGYALGWLRPPGWRWWRRGLFATYAVPQTILFVPLYEVVIRLGLDNNLAALLLTYPMLALPFCVWLFSAYWERVPRALEEAARVDGAGPAAVFFRILLPLATPVVVAAGVFTLGTVASDFMLASVFLTDPRAQTIPAGVGTMDVSLEELTAVAAINVLGIPIALLCAVFVRSYLRGLTTAMAEGA